MKKILLTVFMTTAFAIPAAAADNSAAAESFQRDAGRNHSQLTAEVHARQDMVQLYTNRELNGSDALYASFNRDLYRVATPAADETGRTGDFTRQYVNRELNGTDALYASFKRDNYRAPVSAQRPVERSNTLQQQINVALRYQENALVASFERNLGVTVLPIARQAIILGLNCEGGLWNGRQLTAFA